MKKNSRYKIQDKKCISFFDKGIFGFYWDYQLYRIRGVATAAGELGKAEAPGSVINEFFES